MLFLIHHLAIWTSDFIQNAFSIISVSGIKVQA